MKKIIIGIAIAAFLAVPALGDNPERRPERPERPERSQRVERGDRAPNPYSNVEQARKRRIRDAIREADRPRRGTYRFKSLSDRRPEQD